MRPFTFHGGKKRRCFRSSSPCLSDRARPLGRRTARTTGPRRPACASAGRRRGRATSTAGTSGAVPAMVPVEYPQEVERKTRKATYWETQPGEAFLFTIASLGIYFPFSFIPVDTVSSQEPLASFKDNRFSVVVDAGERGKWEKEVVLTGEEELRVEPALRR